MFRICMKAVTTLRQIAVGLDGCHICKLERRLEKKESLAYQRGRTSLESDILLLWCVN